MLKITYKREGRKFHDVVPFVIFVIYTIGIFTVFFFHLDSTIFSSLKRFFIDNMLPIVNAFSIVILLYLTLLFGSIFVPEFLIHFSFTVFPIIFLLLSLFTGEIYGIILSVISVVVDYLFYFFMVRKRIRYSSTILKCSSNILIPYYPVLIIHGLLSITFVLLIFILCDIVDFNLSYEFGILFFCVLIFYYYWIFFNTGYFLNVLVSSITFLDIFKNQLKIESILGNSYFNSIMCLGSICLGGFLVAFVTTCKHLLNDSEEYYKKKGVTFMILFILIYTILSIIEDIITYVNQWVFAYMAIRGESYKNSLKQSYKILISGKNQMLLDNSIISHFMNSFVFLFLFCAGCIMEIAGKMKMIEFTYKNILEKIDIYFIIILGAFSVISIFKASVNTFLFCFNEDSGAIKNRFPKTYDILMEFNGLNK